MRRSHRRSAEDNQNQEPGPEAGRKTETSSPSQTFSSHLFRYNINLSCCSSYQYYGLSAVYVCLLYTILFEVVDVETNIPVSLLSFPADIYRGFPHRQADVRWRNCNVFRPEIEKLENKQANIIKKRNLFP